MLLLFILLSILQFVSPTSSLPPLYLGPQLLSARLYLLKELPFPLFASRLPFHSYSSSLQAWMLIYCVFLFSALARVTLFFVLCSAKIYSSYFLSVCFHANGMKCPCKWLYVVNSSMLFRLVHNSSAGVRCFSVCASSVTSRLRSFLHCLCDCFQG